MANTDETRTEGNLPLGTSAPFKPGTTVSFKPWNALTTINASWLRRLVFQPVLWLGILCLWFCVRYVTQDPPKAHTASPYAQGDGTYYYLYLRSALFDRDLDFANDLSLVGQPFGLGVSSVTGRPKNFWTCGTALMWSPFAVAARLSLAATNGLGLTNEEPNGAGPLFQRITFFGSVAWGLASLWFTWFFCRRFFTERIALFASLAMGLATPLSWYMLRQPSFSHASSAAAVAIFVWFWYRSQGQRTFAAWAILGLLLGIAMLVRPQDAIHTILPLFEWTMLAIGALREKDRRRFVTLVLKGCVFALSTIAVYGIQVLAWRSIYGHWYLDAHDSNFLDFKTSRFLEVLLSSRTGLFAWHPLVYVATIGLVAAAVSRRIAPKSRSFARLALVVIVLQAFVNGATVDWWGGWSFGGRRFLGCTIYFGFGMAAVFDGIIGLVQRFSSFFIKVALPAAILILPVAYNFQLSNDYASKLIPPAVPQDMLAIWMGATNRLLISIYETTGNLGSAPLNWWLASAANTSPAKYDLLSSIEIFYDHRGPVPVSLSDDRYALSGFGPKTSLDARPAHWVQGNEATWGFALRKAESIVANGSVFAAQVPVHVRLVMAGREVLNRDVTNKGWTALQFSLPKAALRSGINIVRIEQTIPPATAPKDPNDLPGLAWGNVTLTPKNP